MISKLVLILIIVLGAAVLLGSALLWHISVETDFSRADGAAVEAAE